MCDCRLSMEEIKVAENEKKKGPGRPRKNPMKTAPVKLGIIRQPTNPNAAFELSYESPSIFHRVIKFFMAMEATQVQFIFRPEEVIIYSVDHSEVSQIYVRMDCKKMNSYYCNHPVEIGVILKDLVTIFKKIDGDHTNVTIYSAQENLNRSITVMFSNTIKVDEIHTINTTASYTKMTDETLFTDRNFMISFEFTSKYFQKLITDVKNMEVVSMFIFQEHRNDRLQFEYLAKNKKISTKNICQDDKKINLVSHLNNDESFRIKVDIVNIICVANAHLDTVQFLLDENKKFTAQSITEDGVFTLRTVTDFNARQTAVKIGNRKMKMK